MSPEGRGWEEQSRSWVLMHSENYRKGEGGRVEEGRFVKLSWICV